MILKVLSVCKTKQKLFMNTRYINKSYNKERCEWHANYSYITRKICIKTKYFLCVPKIFFVFSVVCWWWVTKFFFCVIYGDCVFWVSLGIHLNKRNPIYEPIYIKWPTFEGIFFSFLLYIQFFFGR